MKKMIVSALMLAAMTTASYAKEVKSSAGAAITATPQDDNKTKIDPSALPDPVKTTLAGDAYKDWKVSAAWVVNATPVSYAVELKKDDKTTTLNIDKDGKVK